MELVAVLAAFWAAWLVVRRPDVLARRLAPAREPARQPSRWRRWWPVAVAAGVAVGVGLAQGVFIGVAAGLPVGTALWMWRMYRARAQADRRRAGVLDACRALAGLLRIGHVPDRALRAVADDVPVLAEVAAVHEIGGEVSPVLRRLGGVPGNEGLVELANAWEVAERTGASLTATLDAMAQRQVAQESVQQVVKAELSAPRATGKLLAALPFVGVVLGFAIGGNPLEFLTGSLAGQIVLVTGVALACAGVAWTERIADGV